MANNTQLLDQALDLGEQELKHLAAGRVLEAETMAKERSRIMDAVFHAPDSSSQSIFLEKLGLLQSLQGRLSLEARRLHESIKAELQRSRQEGVRMTGYHKAVKFTPGHSRFISKQG